MRRGHPNVPIEDSAGGYGAPLTQAYVSIEDSAGGYGAPLTQAYVSTEDSAGGYGAPLTQAYVSGSQSGAEYVTQQEVQRQADAQAQDYNVVVPGVVPAVYIVPLGDGDEPEYVTGLVDTYHSLTTRGCVLFALFPLSVSSLSPAVSLAAL